MDKAEQNCQFILRNYHRPIQNVERLCFVFDNYKETILKRITALVEVLPILAVTERKLLGMQHWIAYNDLESEMVDVLSRFVKYLLRIAFFEGCFM